MGIAIICRNANYANKGLGKVTMGASTDVYPTSISISGSSEFSGASSQYSVSYTPSNANMTGVTWSITSGSEYATISSGGLLTMKDTSLSSDVTITIKATSTYSSAVYAEKTITWKTSYEEVYPTALTINGNAEFSTTTSQYSVGYTPSNANVLGVTWSVVSGGEYATIDQSGLLTMTDTSMTEDVNITIKVVSTADASVYAEKTLTWVYVSEDTDIYPTALTINGEESFNGDSLQLSVGYTPTTTNKTEVTWSLTSGTEYASIDQNGLITMSDTSMANDVTIGVKVVSQHDSSVYAEKTITWVAEVVEGGDIDIVWSYGFWDGSVNESTMYFHTEQISLTKNCSIKCADGYQLRLVAFNVYGKQLGRSGFLSEIANLKESLLALNASSGMWALNFFDSDTASPSNGVELTDAILQNMSNLVTFSNIEDIYDSAIDKSSLTIETYGIKATTGELVSGYSKWSSSDYINIASFSTLTLLTTNDASSFGIAFYDSEKAYVSGVIYDINVYETIDISNYTYLRFCSENVQGVLIGLDV